MKSEESTPSIADEALATQLDALIDARQRGDTAPAASTDAVLVDQLIEWAATTTPTPHFVAQLEEQLQTQFSQQRQRQSVRNQQVTPRLFNGSLLAWLFPPRRLAFALGTLILVVSLLLTTPVARATLWDWLYGFGLVEETQLTGRTIPVETPAQPTDASAPLTLATIQQQAPFKVQPPTQLPAGLRFTGGFVMPTATETSVTLAYHLTDEPAGGYPLDAPLLFVAISDGALPNRPLVAEGYQQAVIIGKNVGIYTHGDWQSDTPARPTDSQTGPLSWDPEADVAWLTWQADGLNYLLYAQGLGLTADDMAQIAESMASKG